MALKKFNPITPGQRGLVIVDRSNLYKGDPVKNLRKVCTRQVVEITQGMSLVASWRRSQAQVSCDRF